MQQVLTIVIVAFLVLVFIGALLPKTETPPRMKPPYNPIISADHDLEAIVSSSSNFLGKDIHTLEQLLGISHDYGSYDHGHVEYIWWSDTKTLNVYTKYNGGSIMDITINPRDTNHQI